MSGTDASKRVSADSRVLARLRRQLLRWSANHARELPWRRARDAYRVWISEIMLQQTTVAAVIPYFERFVARFPTLAALGSADEHEVLRLWEGLGYYSRARNLHAAAREVIREHRGIVPSDVATLQTLPGIGRYTAGAIASLAYNKPAPIVEANTARVYARLLALQEPADSTVARNAVWAFAERAVPPRAAGAFNEALMDLGATVCVPVSPRCEVCPICSCCQAFRDGMQNEIPPPRIRPEPTSVTQAMIAVRRGQRYLLRRSPTGERWAGLWEFLRVPLDSEGRDEVRPKPSRGVLINSGGRGSTRLSSPKSRRAAPNESLKQTKSGSAGASPSLRATKPKLERAVATLCGLDVDADPDGFELRHTVTRFRIRLLCTTARYRGGVLETTAQYRWVRPDEFPEFAFSMPARKFADRLAATNRNPP
jgi:A/G-specific adenine glycosylase